MDNLDFYKYKVIESGNVVEVYEYELGIKKLIQKGERENYEKGQEGQKREDSLYRTRQNIIRLINTNITKYSKFITLTYSDNIQDRKKVLKDFRIFREKWQRTFGYKLKYVAVIETQQRGSLHIHTVVFNDQVIDFKKLKNVWVHGTTNVHVIDDRYRKNGLIYYKNKDSYVNIGVYMAKYITKEIVDFGNQAILRSKDLKSSIIKEYVFKPSIPDYRLKWESEYYQTYLQDGQSVISKIKYKEYIK